jgi:hypothetical protein
VVESLETPKPPRPASPSRRDFFLMTEILDLFGNPFVVTDKKVGRLTSQRRYLAIESRC